MWTLTSSALLTVLIGLQVMGEAPAPGPEHPEYLTTKTISAICDMSTTTFCSESASSSDPDNVCTQMAKDVERGNYTDPNPACDHPNACSFLTLINGTFNGLVFVSYKNRCEEAVTAGGRIFKTCPNSLIIYSLYP